MLYYQALIQVLVRLLTHFRDSQGEIQLVRVLLESEEQLSCGETAINEGGIESWCLQASKMIAVHMR